MRLCARLLLFGLFVGLSLRAPGAFPRHEFLDLPVGSTLGRVGSSALSAFWDGEDLAFRIARSVAARLDLTALGRDDDLFSLGARIVVLDEPGLLALTCQVEAGALRMLASVPLGPVRLDFGRAFGTEGRSWILTTSSLSETWALVLGIEYGEATQAQPVVGARFLPGLGLSLFAGLRGPTLLFSLGGER